MKRFVITVAAALVLMAVLAPASFAKGDAVAIADEPAPTSEPAATPEPSPTPVENGEITIDPTFIVATPTPAGAVQGATGRPDLTPPPTHTIPAATTSSTGLRALLVLGVAGASLALVAGRAPAARR